MSWLLFLDESGHDHKHMPYEVRGGVALHARELWPFVRAVDDLEYATFGLFVSSILSIPVQAADLCIYCLN
ncbi:MAG TPA: hypothetical protein VGY77_06845, partial [Gemmataceae bacterium]|nr:hypothetical protein [Gemmataceae bacterium]